MSLSSPLTALSAALAALAVAGCGGASNTASRIPSAHDNATTPAQSGTAATTTSTSTATTTTPGSTTTPTQGVSACVASNLTPAFVGSNGAMGHVVLSFVVHNSGTTSCHTYGFPGVQFLTKGGTPIPTNAKRVVQDYAGTVPEAAITLTPGQEASFRVITSDVTNSQASCVTGYALQIIAPDDTTPMRAPMPDGASICGGQATVSPLAAGRGALAGS